MFASIDAASQFAPGNRRGDLTGEQRDRRCHVGAQRVEPRQQQGRKRDERPAARQGILGAGINAGRSD